MAVVQALQGYDASNWKDDLDPNAVPHDFAFWQTTWGAGALTNARNHLVKGVYVNADAKIQAEIKRGTPWGFMHYIRGEASAESEAQFFIDHNRGYFNHGVPSVDWESGDNAAYGDIGYLDRWLAYVIAHTGVKPLVYFSGGDGNRVRPICAKYDCGAWPAAYGSTNPTGYQASPWGENTYPGVMRQYASSGRLAGYTGALDLDKFYGSAEQLWAYAKRNGSAPTPQPTVIPATEHIDINQMARDTVLGKYGDGDARKTVLGSNYSLVQQRVNVLDSIAEQVIKGAYGNGNDRQQKLGKDYQAVQQLVNNRVAKKQPSTSRTYTIKSGEILSNIAPRLGWNYLELAKHNGIADPNKIYPGQVIKY